MSVRGPLRQRSIERRWLALPVALARTFMVTFDFLVANVAVPTMQADPVATATSIEWVVAGYGLAFAAGLLVGARIAQGAAAALMTPQVLAIIGLALSGHR